jgi:type II secretory pathway pseudopilin PulG
MTLVEVMVASGLLFIVSAALISAAVAGTRLNYSSAQHVSAFGLCKERLEQMRALATTNFAGITTAAFPTETITLTHAGGTIYRALGCSRSSTVTTLDDPLRKSVTISVAWTFAGRNRSERIDTVLYFKE